MNNKASPLMLAQNIAETLSLVDVSTASSALQIATLLLEHRREQQARIDARVIADKFGMTPSK